MASHVHRRVYSCTRRRLGAIERKEGGGKRARALGCPFPAHPSSLSALLSGRRAATARMDKTRSFPFPTTSSRTFFHTRRVTYRRSSRVAERGIVDRRRCPLQRGRVHEISPPLATPRGQRSRRRGREPSEEAAAADVTITAVHCRRTPAACRPSPNKRIADQRMHGARPAAVQRCRSCCAARSAAAAAASPLRHDLGHSAPLSPFNLPLRKRTPWSKATRGEEAT